MVRFEVSRESPEPFHVQIASAIGASVERGGFLPGERLPSVRELARALGVDSNIVHKAYAELERAGLVHSVLRKGTFAGPAGESAPEEALARRRFLRSMDALLDAAGECGLPVDQVLSELRLRARFRGRRWEGRRR